MARGGGVRAPHYYPESVRDRLASNLVNISFKPLPAQTRLELARDLIRQFRAQSAMLLESGLPVPVA